MESRMNDIDPEWGIAALEWCRSQPMSACSGEDGLEDVIYDDVAPTDAISARVAARVLIARGFFAPGDEIVFGKYKNKHGIIERIWADDRGHPMIEIRPVPQGRKKNKIMGLYKIWHDPDPPDPEEEEKKTAAERVVERYAASVVLEKKFGRFKVIYLKQHEEHVDKLGALLEEAERMYAAAGVPIVHDISSVLSGRGASHAGALYTMGSVPPTIQFAPKSYEDPKLIHTVIHELGHYCHDKVVPGGINNSAIISKHMWAVRQKSTGKSNKVDILNRKMKALNEAYSRLSEEQNKRKPLPRKGQVFEYDTWVNGVQYHVKGRIVGKADSRTVNVEVIDAPEAYIKRQQIYRRGPGPLIVPESVDSLTYAGKDEAKEAELKKVEEERHTVYVELSSLIKSGEGRSDYKTHLHDWVPTNYARKNHMEYFAEMMTTYILGHLKPEPSEWLKSVVKTGKAPEAPEPVPTEEPE
jgi:hypothetical protein